MTLSPGERINETEYLSDGRSARYRAFINGAWGDWFTAVARRHDYTRPAPNVGRVQSYDYRNDGSTPTSTTTMTFTDATTGTWEEQNHHADVRSWGTFTLRKASE